MNLLYSQNEYAKMIKESKQNVYEIKCVQGEYIAGLNLGLHPANERWRYKVTLSLIGWVQT